MLTKQEIKDIVSSYKITQTIHRPKYTEVIFKYIDRKEILVLKGIRRCGKSTILKQIIQKLENKNCVYVNLDDYRFLDYLTIDLLEEILNA